jgi:predicted metal-binding membrane protein
VPPPLGFLIGNWRAGSYGALRMGLQHGGYCLPCCWFQMGLLFFGGVMSPLCIVGLAVFVLLEKTIRRRSAQPCQRGPGHRHQLGLH